MTAHGSVQGPETPLGRLLGDASARTLERELSLHTAEDLLNHIPRRWVEHGQLSSLAELREDEHVTFVARVVSASKRRMQRRRGFLVEVVVEDDDGVRLQMAFFQGHQAFRDLTSGARAMFHGKVGSYGGRLTLNNPDYSVLPEDGDVGPGADSRGPAGVPLPGEGQSTPVPLYPATAKVSSWEIYRCVRLVLDMVDLDAWPDPVPTEVSESEGLRGLATAYLLIHRPARLEDPAEGLKRLRFQEAFLLQALLARRRVLAGSGVGRPAPRREDGLLGVFDAALPFTLTEGQRRCGELIAEDLSGAAPMNRLLQGEVGSGKTLVALRAMLQVVDAGAQAALVAPTEVLAAQHERSLRGMLGALAGTDLLSAWDAPDDAPAVTVTLLTGSMSTAERKQALLDIASGRAGIVVGTHALLGEKVQFADLGLVVVDEQHRFGVEQRDALRHRYPVTPHMLVMSATPIPRSVAMTVFGDLELTMLAGLPAGRQPIRTHVARMTQGPRIIGRVWERIAEEVAAGHQAYVVCPKISESDQREDPATGVQIEQDASVELLADRLAEHPLIGRLRLASLHGRMDSSEKEEVMTAFERGEIDVLLSTTVIEVGVDVPNATVMAVLDADAFGISTLHQLRGRIGRGSAQGLCLLVTRLPDGHPSLERLEEVAAHSDGMQLARLDLQRRREGDVLGASQAGRSSTLKLLRIVRDEGIISSAADHVQALTANDPGWEGHPQLREAIDSWIARSDGADAYIERG
ncbi:ATP-dependent DNA helicase RecG [Nesterenkonia sp. CL21]|uniref:ATP-dependent DNA helicase RecG n=1 Tax=Nesterenkonia sp. CL21 TaxID=3064894 RepID=UPI00287958FC|nr:ATP-dependent DNA helicase RecG [Nesterenkonia sp. CL21]MDS2171564.1 ATP-dependent DNA helicase RecG [Nesterenkonia sp. CL21]